MRTAVLCLYLAFYTHQAAAQIRLPQSDGGILELREPATRLITLAPHLTELVFAAGAGDLLIATGAYSEFPEAAKSLPRIGDAFRIDMERIIALQPELILAWDSGNPRLAIGQLRALGLPTWTLEIRQPGEIAVTLQQIGEATGRVDSGRRAAVRFMSRLNRLASRYSEGAPLDYFYQVEQKPLFTINGTHLISQVLSLCGGRNIFGDESALAFQVTHEAVVLANPHALFAPAVTGQADPLAEWKQWPGLTAVRHGALFLLPADEISRATPRLLDAAEIACRLLDGLRERLPDG